MPINDDLLGNEESILEVASDSSESVVGDQSSLPEMNDTTSRSRIKAIEDCYLLGLKGYSDINPELFRQFNPSLAFGSRASYNRFIKKHGLGGPRKCRLTPDNIRNIVQEAAEDIGINTHGYRAITNKLRLQGLLIPRDAVYTSLKEVDNSGLASRRPGVKRTFRSPIISVGPNEQWSLDGHDKLSMWGFGIYGIKDVYSGKLLALHTFPSNRLQSNPYWLYLDTVCKVGGIPIQIATDRGSETGSINETQTMLRSQLSPISLEDMPPHIYLKSIRNITIERTWVGVRVHVVDVIKCSIDEGQRRIFIWTNAIHRTLFLWLFAPLVQVELDKYVLFFNTYPVRKQKDKANPSGGRRMDFYNSPERWGGTECGQELAGLTDSVKLMTEEAKKDASLDFVTEEAAKICEDTRVALGGGCPPLELKSIWDVFEALLPWVREPLAGTSDVLDSQY